MKSYDKVSSFRGANTLFQGQQNKGRSDRKKRYKREKREEKSHKRDQSCDQRPDPRRRAEEPRPLRDRT
jgi:hypothetical protein